MGFWKNLGKFMFNPGYRSETLQNWISGSSSSAQDVSSELSDAIDGTTQAENNALIQSLIQQQMDYQTNSAQVAMDFERQQADLQYQRATELAGSSVQRRVKDLQAAGLNPILAVSNGIQGAETPSLSTASGFSQSGSILRPDTYNQLFAALGSILDGVSTASNIALNGAKSNYYKSK